MCKVDLHTCMSMYIYVNAKFLPIFSKIATIKTCKSLFTKITKFSVPLK